MATVQSAGITDVGQKRKGNEDSLFLDDAMGLYVVADGMGGHAAGEVASRLVVDTIRNFVQQFSNNPAGAAQLPVSDKKLSTQSNLLLNAVHLANRSVFQNARKNIARKGMGSTVSAVLMGDKRLSVVNVGDSPIYLIQGSSIKLVSTPHTMMAEYKEMAKDSDKQVGEHLRHVLTRAMGLKEQVEPSAVEIPVTGDEIVVISSDGLTDKVTAEEILEVVTYERPERAGKSLVALANERGGDDNITVIVLRIGDRPVAAKPEPKTSPKGIKKSAGGLRIAVDYDTEEASRRTYVTEVSLEGVFLETKEAIAVGDEITLTLSLGEGRESMIMITGRVASRESKGIFVKFENLTPVQRRWIDSLPRG